LISLDELQNAILIASKFVQLSFDFNFDENFVKNFNSEVHFSLQSFKLNSEEKAIEDLIALTLYEEPSLSVSQ